MPNFLNSVLVMDKIALLQAKTEMVMRCAKMIEKDFTAHQMQG